MQSAFRALTFTAFVSHVAEAAALHTKLHVASQNLTTLH